MFCIIGPEAFDCRNFGIECGPEWDRLWGSFVNRSDGVMPSDFVEDFASFMQRLPGIGSAAALAAATVEATRTLGLGTVMAGGIAFDGTGVEAEFYFGNWPGNWKRLYTREVLSDDPLVAEARRRMLPFTRSELEAEGDLSPAMQQAIDTTRLHGWSDGFAVPVHGPSGLTGLVSFAGGPLALEPPGRGLLFALAHAAFWHGRRLHAAQNSAIARPTPREVQIFRLVAQGLPDRAIAADLGIAATTVRFHVDGLRRRLNARSRAQAVALLIANGHL